MSQSNTLMIMIEGPRPGIDPRTSNSQGDNHYIQGDMIYYTISLLVGLDGVTDPTCNLSLIKLLI